MASNNSGDSSAFAPLCTDDAIIIRGNDLELIGKEAILSSHRTHHDQFNEEITGELVEVEVFGDWAYVRRISTIKLIPRDGAEPVGLTARVIELLKRQPDASWKIYRLMSSEFWDSQE